MTAARWTKLVLAVLVLATGALFTVQNLARTSDLSLSFGFYAVHLEQPMPVPYLLWSAFAIGLCCGALMLWLSGSGKKSATTRASNLGVGSDLGAAGDDWT